MLQTLPSTAWRRVRETGEGQSRDTPSTPPSLSPLGEPTSQSRRNARPWAGARSRRRRHPSQGRTIPRQADAAAPHLPVPSRAALPDDRRLLRAPSPTGPPSPSAGRTGVAAAPSAGSGARSRRRSAVAAGRERGWAAAGAARRSYSDPPIRGGQWAAKGRPRDGAAPSAAANF